MVKCTNMRANMFRKQRGQSMVLVMLFTSVTLLSIVLLYNTGQLSREKMELQNAADALAYSDAVLEARALNFIAYTNRAKVANEVFIGQLTAFETWGKRYEEAPNSPTINAISTLPIIGPAAAGAIKATLAPFAFMGSAASKVSNNLSKRAIPIIARLNQQLFSAGQRGFRLATLTAQAQITDNIIDNNAPGSEISFFGTTTAIASTTEFHAIFLKEYQPKNNKKENKDALRQFAGVVNASGDQWINDRSRDDLQLKVEIVPGVDVSGGYATAGGSELRFVKRGGKEYYNWSSLDTIEGFMELDASLFSVRFPLPIGGSSKQWRVGNNGLTFGDAGWKSSSNHYGGAWQKTPVTASMAVNAYRPQPPASYRGLAAYTGMNQAKYKNRYAGPAFVVGLKKTRDKIRTTDNTNIKNSVQPLGSLAVNTDTAGGSSWLEKDPSLHAISAGEAYYKRPGSNEYANLFSPYWQPRLTEVDNTTKKLANVAQTGDWKALLP